MTEGYVKCTDMDVFNTWNADLKTRIQTYYTDQGSSRIFTNYTFAYDSAGSDVYAFVNGDHASVATESEMALILSEAEAIADGMIIPEDIE